MHVGVLILLGDFDDPAVGIDLDPIAGFDDLQRGPIEIGHGRGVGDDRAEGDLVVISLRDRSYSRAFGPQ
jgi:hypothetical protein